VEHVLATQTLPQQPARNMLVRFNGHLNHGVSAKDLVLNLIGQVGTAGATGHVIEYAGDVLKQLDMSARMTICNMSIEAGARAGLIAPDDVTFEYLAGRRYVPEATDFQEAVSRWQALRTDPGAKFDLTVDVDVSRTVPMVTWGTSPEAVVGIDGRVPDPASVGNAAGRANAEQMLRYMGLRPEQSLRGIPIDVAFIGSCTNGRLEDLRAAAAVVAGRRVSASVRALVVPGSGMVKAAAEAEGLHGVFKDAGFEWRESGCSMCLGMNPDKLAPLERCASSSNRNFEGRQGPGGRTHLMSPAMVAAAAIEGCITDVREYMA
jgi:3-isopropylmalate/(R)-2-methylmalate dehydratase large subunit